jgi:membrane-associated phospholipid phosphatase
MTTTDARSGTRSGSAGSHPARFQTAGNRKVVAARLLGGAVVLWGLLALIGLFVTHVISSNGSPSWDRAADTWFAAHRTSLLNTVSWVGSGIANTQSAVAVTVVVVLVLRWRLGRWYESWVVVAAITGELWIFLAVTATVHRARPPVVRLDVSPPTSSFPSGHTAASIALYGCIALLVVGLWPGTRSGVIAFLLFVLPVVVGLSRLYRGMHYPSDIVVGALGGGLWLAVVVWTLMRPARPAHERQPDLQAAA